MRRIGVMATLWNFAGEDAKFLDPRRVFKPALAGFWAEQGPQPIPLGSMRCAISLDNCCSVVGDPRRCRAMEDELPAR